ncbi:hypothetical protein M413DRAFT_19543 [Hebeloma cylindrosporum]|uniref:Initiator tRNA phosphoribosyl transferase n=1 Tax=Hebeloma cylindrosporum TaxID=76867 RepID=A0A0C3BST8_HEBCY|nr:hypothetical protein M413DRAFT_19543 [Hebeloma cylindrosporum h7]
MDIDALSYLRRECADIYNRLHSIEEDVAFVNRVTKAYPEIPILPNLRCGAWYTDPALATNVPAYFKSTDGHFNNWSFNLRRSNLHLLPLIIEKRGLILVDSTRSGKKIPDALSKTVPIWCAVINRAHLIRHSNPAEKGNSAWDTKLYTPPSTVSRQEHDQIEQRLDGWAQALGISSFSLPSLPSPLRPIWITPANSMFPNLDTKQTNEDDFLPVICVSASKQIEQGVERRTSGFSYIQGSGDDHELWGMGLTPGAFWANRAELLSADRALLSSLVSRIVSTPHASPGVVSNPERSRLPPTAINKVAGRLMLCTTSDLPVASVTETNTLLCIFLASSQENLAGDPNLYLPVISGKKGASHFLQVVLPRSMEFIQRHLAAGKNICVACESGKDLSVGVVLTALQLFFGDDGSLNLTAADGGKRIIEGGKSLSVIHFNDVYRGIGMDKASIRTRLEWIIASRPEANPSRTTLKRVNEFLLTAPFRGAAPLLD